MNLDLQYIVAAIKAMHAAAEAIRCGTPEQRGHAAAGCLMAAIDLEVRIGTVAVGVTGGGIHQTAERLQ